ncbi:hypothetical protein SAMD00019534_015060 [Acytostelium subglobosum LB1]|uniref:hypothetical protein n=1 Tax=Acytostelium subglobosum LB1 TaxID=1410327 RepID=UPI0006451198|nr:hypothetical protein SAMD00019534_015060 [Acytostelium subglobosum LB1]GAM18331.1 hypothetical protein SAMD00019534_015060 [Acytostelium subglobosum LB1]|eukprot:XP_012757551.1 hypothetical protein SAMD00019534_015060 [Acytostelium subglobosum LB1]
MIQQQDALQQSRQDYPMQPTSMFNSSSSKVVVPAQKKMSPASTMAKSNEQVVPSVKLIEDPFARAKIDSKTLDLYVANKDSVTKALVPASHQMVDASLNMRRSFRVGWGPNGQLALPHKTSLKTLIVQKKLTKSSVSSNSIVEHLKSHLTNSSVSSKDNRAGWFTLSHVQDQLAAQTHNKDISDVSGRIWRLVTALWGTDMKPSTLQYSEEMKRRLNLNQWLKEVIAPIVEKELKDSKKSPNASHLDAIFSHLSGKQISESTSCASNNKDHRLAVMMSQVWAAAHTKDLLREQMTQWSEQGMLDTFEPKRVEILNLISGDIDHVYKNVNDWYRCFAINFWYKYTFNSPLPDIINSYEDSFQKSASTAPVPHYMANQRRSMSRNEYLDTCYLLLKLFGLSRFDRFDTIFYPENTTPDILDYSLSWNLFTVLQALPQLNKQPDISNQPLLHCSFASQLEHIGLWQWAVYVLSHIPDRHCFLREEAMKSLISRHVHTMKTNDRVFLTNSLLIPAVWIDECLSWSLGYEHQSDQFAYLMKSGQYSAAHDLVLEDFGPNYIITSQHNNLRDLLRRFQGHIDTIATWKVGGAIFQDYLHISMQIRECLEEISTISNQTVHQNNKEKLRELTMRATSLCSEISHLTTTNYVKNASKLYKVALSEISRGLMAYLKSAYELLSEFEGQTNSNNNMFPASEITSLLKPLPITDDYRVGQLDFVAKQCQDSILNAVYSQ